MTPSQSPPGMLSPPAPDAFPIAEAHAVPAYSPVAWAASAVRWWRVAFPSNAYGRRTVGDPRRGGEHFFQHLMPREAPPAPLHAAAVTDTAAEPKI